MKFFFLSLLMMLAINSMVVAQVKDPVVNGAYFFSKEVRGDFDDIVERVTALFKEEQFGVVSELNMDETINKKLGTHLKRYKILGMCNPEYANKAIQVEPNIGLMLPCKVLIQEMDEGVCSVSVIDPETTMKSINNPGLDEIARSVSGHFKRAIEKL